MILTSRENDIADIAKESGIDLNGEEDDDVIINISKKKKKKKDKASSQKLVGHRIYNAFHYKCTTLSQTFLKMALLDYHKSKVHLQQFILAFKIMVKAFADGSNFEFFIVAFG